MKISCGVDIVEIDRIKEAIERNNEKFLNEVFTKKEISYCESKKNAKYQHYAARFAAKEAAYKATSLFLQNKYSVSWKQFEVENDENGRPKIVFHDTKFEKKIQDCDISISHSKTNAIAVVTILYL